MRAQLVKIGNSRGVRLPKTIIQEAGLGRDLDITIEGGAVVIRSAGHPRRGWAEDAQKCRAADDDSFEDWDVVTADGDWR